MLRLDSGEHQQRLALTFDHVKPRLVILDPLIRLHQGDENSAADVSLLLGGLRQLQRNHEVAIVLVHHTRKSSSAQPGQALRGSGDLHAWSDSNLYLLHGQNRLELHVEHRSHPSPKPLEVELRDTPTVHLRVVGDLTDEDDKVAEPDPLKPRILAALANQPMARTALRQLLGVRNERLGQALADLEAGGKLRRCDGLVVPVPAP